jgi:hypothetical protein
MGMGIMLLLVTHDYIPIPEVVEMWLQAMVHDDRSIRMMAFQVRRGFRGRLHVYGSPYDSMNNLPKSQIGIQFYPLQWSV